MTFNTIPNEEHHGIVPYIFPIPVIFPTMVNNESAPPILPAYCIR